MHLTHQLLCFLAYIVKVGDLTRNFCSFTPKSYLGECKVREDCGETTNFSFSEECDRGKVCFHKLTSGKISFVQEESAKIFNLHGAECGRSFVPFPEKRRNSLATDGQFPWMVSLVHKVS